ncbi:permease [Nitratireductor sp. XY-223]|uniref:permease n=1 Tax=Nitratireductor sp. XY-223 TaxID=2561926 RepID=UPI0010AB103A|nr:permease [Nitratireductor sp. XY-223]
MSDFAAGHRPIVSRNVLLALAAVALATAALLRPGQTLDTARFVALSLVEVAPLIIPGILLAAWVAASGAGDRVAGLFGRRMLPAVVAASAIGAVTPVCGVTVLPLMAGLLAAGVPLAPVMAFWLSSPVTDPAMLAATAATLGLSFAVGKTLAAFGLGILGGSATWLVARRPWIERPLRKNAIVGSAGSGCCDDGGFDWAVWTDPARRRRFGSECRATGRLVLICLIPAFAAEHVLNGLLHPEALSAYVGEDSWWAVPLAVFVGAPAYVDGYAALPLTRALIDHGMAPGAAMAFLVSGSAVSIWGALAIFPVLKAKPFLLFVALAVIGSLASGWLFQIAV